MGIATDIIQRVHPDSGVTFNYREVDNYYDGTPMNLTKVDGVIYREKNGIFYKKSLDYFGENFLNFNSIQELRDVSDTDLLLLKMGYYKGVLVSGYFEKGDTPAPIIYDYKEGSSTDNGGRVIKINDECYFECESLKGEVRAVYYGVKKTPIGEPIFDVYPYLNNLCNDPLVRNIIFEEGNFIVNTNAKLDQKNMKGSLFGTTLQFKKPDSGFRMYKEGVPIVGIGYYEDIIFQGEKVCKSLFEVRQATEGFFKNVYFHGWLKVFSINIKLDIAHFINCTFSYCEDVFYVEDNADEYTSINSTYLIGGNYYDIRRFINTNKGGNINISKVWFEKTNTILHERGSNPGNSINISNCEIIKSTKQDEYTIDDTAPVFVISNAGSSSIISQSNNFKSAVSHDLIKVVNHTGDINATKIIKFLGGNKFLIDGLQSLISIDSGISNLYLINYEFRSNYIDFSYSWRNNPETKVTPGIVFYGSNEGKYINFRLGLDNESKLQYNDILKKIYVVNNFETEKHYLQDTNANFTASRPTNPVTAQMFFDLTLNKPIWFDGISWRDATGTTV